MERNFTENKNEMIMKEDVVRVIFKMGADALYNTLDPNNGNVDDKFNELMDDAVKLFSISNVVRSVFVIKSKDRVNFMHINRTRDAAEQTMSIMNSNGDLYIEEVVLE